MGWAIIAYACFAVPITLKRLLFEDGRALWIGDGLLIFLSRWLFSVRCDEVEKLSTSRDKRGEVIVVHLKGGRQKIFPTGSLREPTKAVFDKLNDLLALPSCQ